MKRLTLLLVLMLLVAQVRAFAQITAVPQLMNFSGRLAKPDGTPVPDGTYSIRFSLWSAASGGTEKWNQTLNPVAVRNGTFAAQLNTSTGAADKFHNNLWLEIKVGTDAPLTPRQPLASVAYAFKADSVKDGSITANSLANNAVTAAKIADNAISTSKLANGSVTSAKLDSSLQGMLGGFTSDNAHVALVGSVDIGASAFGVVASGNYAYVIAGFTSGALLVYDVSNPTAPTYKSSVALGTTPKGIAIAGNHVYLIGSDNLLRIYDVSNPANPIRRSSTATVGSPTSVAVSGSHAYVAGGTNHLQIFNISNPAAPVLRSTASTLPGTIPTSVAVSGNHAFVVTRGNGPKRLISIDVSNPAAPVTRGNVETGFDPIFVKASGSYVYVSHQVPGGPLQIYSISNPAQPTFVNNIVTLGHPMSVALSGPYAFVACQGFGTLQVFDVAAPLAPKYIEAHSTGSSLNSVAVSGNYVYTVDHGNLNTTAALKIFARPTQGMNSNLAVRGGGFFYSNLDVDQANLNNGGLANGLTFGSASGEGISSKRTPGGNHIGLDLYTAFQRRLSITNAGKVGIGTDTPAYKLDVIGDLRCIGFTNTSDARYKHNIAALENPLEAILNLRGVSYDWRKSDFPDMNFPAGRQIGFLAQEVEKVLPELVSTDPQGYKSVAYQNVVPVLVEAVKTQQKQHEGDRAKIAALQAELAELKAIAQRLAEQQKAGQK